MIVKVSDFVADCGAEESFDTVEESVAVTLKVNVPVAAGVPLRTPCGLRVRPEGSEPLVTAKVTGAKPPVVRTFVL